ncbi:1,4-dihydroxy-2-naphthoate octaprenyltransferase [Flavobacterium sp.]|jgi:1,4-dihydroxy-2-naphthoate octaprenyltransferase|uniref:1,4-dihydroxy-2-naphthoate octaprenyltransferase n=1 Tax=Flavobacterium sp. TaxID=239 RepID=UPI0022BCA8B0|nr:1,4-dihydroxy-2-naphthoate octaprenyltransferase [Flavobacterium sp.]MCZ8144017.1 1,4-dihydroxy-2-naphthoate octaprenyltransferase [Flavobacterium sp.]MCZ8366502.1 1,4-dihydroxy-2-naphthoate octaprenyltransferase [Flavobacterium sp.]
MKQWIEAARVRTLPLSISGILVGSFFAMSQSRFNWKIVILALTTTVGLQVLSNFANDYGDGVKGTDNADRVGPQRAIQSGAITPGAMRYAIFVTAFLTLVSAILLIYKAFGVKNFLYSLIFFVLGILAIASAIRYTVGKNPYGYRGLGDIFVFVFFGWVSTVGISFMILKELDPVLFLPATAIGFLSVAVLNLNNMRDEVSDRKVGKNTLIVKKGGAWGKKYHQFLIVSAMVLFLAFAYWFDMEYDVNPHHLNIDNYFFVVFYLPLIFHLKRVRQNTEPRLLDPELKKVALSTFFISVVMALQLIFFFSDETLYLLSTLFE